MAQSRAVIAVAAIVVIIIAAFAVYAGITYPRVIVSIPISFSIGADMTTSEFEQPSLNNMVQVQVTVENGVAGWRARILSGDEVIWEDEALQGEQQTYNSGWIALPSGRYNFTFGAIGGSLDAVASVASKGGFW